jgi:type I restriction enzyme R subunit
VRRIAEDISAHFAATGDIGRKYLINHSAGSGKTLTICWLADRLHSLYKAGTSDKLADMVLILTDRKSLDTNIREDIEKFTHLKAIVGVARHSDELIRFLNERRPIIVTTQQKIAWVLEEIQKKPELKNLRVAFLIDEAHRSQEGRMGAAVRLPFRNSEEPDAEADERDEEEEIARVIREHDPNQLFVAFTATPAPATVTLFGQPFDTYSEAEAIEEGYIVDVASSIISYRTLYNLHCRVVPPPGEERLYAKGVVAKALLNVAFQDDALIQYKSEVMLRIFEEDVMPLIGGRAKAMIVTSSRVAGLRYFDIVRRKLKDRGAAYKALYAFSDFVHPETNVAVTEHAVNELKEGELIEDRFEGDDYRIMIVANKFQTGFDQPLLAGMFLDKPVLDRNAVQTVSRLNRCCEGKDRVVVVDFTNNAPAILGAFARYRQGTPFQPDEPDPELCRRLRSEILALGVFTQNDAAELARLIRAGTDARRQYFVSALRNRFLARVPDTEERKSFAYQLARFVKAFHFLTCFFTFPAEIGDFALFCEYVGPQLIKQGGVSDLMKQIRETEVSRAAVEYQGEVRSAGAVRLRVGRGPRGTGPPPRRVSVQSVIDEIRAQYSIGDEEALYIKEVTEEKIADAEIRNTVIAHRDDRMYLDGAYRIQVNNEIQTAYNDRGRYDELADPKYTGPGAIFDIMAVTVIDHQLVAGAQT